jgi:hypothetical protein
MGKLLMENMAQGSPISVSHQPNKQFLAGEHRLLTTQKGTNSITFCANLGKSVTGTLAMIRQAFREELTSHTQKV